MIEKLLAGLVLAVCLVMLLRLALGSARRSRFDRLSRSLWAGLRARALALGARACMIGRAWVYGVAAKGESGVTAVLETMKRELRTSMALVGAPRVSDINSSVIES